MLQEVALTRDETEALVQMEGTFEEVKVIGLTGYHLIKGVAESTYHSTDAILNL